MKFKKVVYLRYMPLTSKIYSDFYFESARNLGLDVEYWDLTNIFFKKVFNIEDSGHLCKIFKLNSYNQFNNEIKKIDDISSTLFVCIMTFEPRIRKILELLTLYNCTVSVFGRNMFPMSSTSNKNYNILKRVNLKMFLNYFKSKIFNYKIINGKIKPYDIVFLGGKAGWQGIGRIKEKDILNSKIIKVNSDDYDNFLKNKNVKSFIDYKYILFLDEYLPLHPDTKIFKINNVKPKDYYPDLCNYFEKVEEHFKLPIIIAAHPKALEYRKKNFFNGRKVVFGKTINLTKFASFVIAHDSTSVNFPICFKKKILFISSKNIKKSIASVHNNTISFSDYLGCSFEWFDETSKKISLINKINEEKYENYKYEFQTWKETENTLTEKIFTDFLKSDYS